MTHDDSMSYVPAPPVQRARAEAAEARVAALHDKLSEKVGPPGVSTEELLNVLVAAWEEMHREAAPLRARVAALEAALTGLENATRILDVMLNEPAAEGLMTAEDYRSYLGGAWLGVDEAAEAARALLAKAEADPLRDEMTAPCRCVYPEVCFCAKVEAGKPIDERMIHPYDIDQQSMSSLCHICGESESSPIHGGGS
jgi:hypothetical protein